MPTPAATHRSAFSGWSAATGSSTSGTPAAERREHRPGARVEHERVGRGEQARHRHPALDADARAAIPELAPGPAPCPTVATTSASSVASPSSSPPRTAVRPGSIVPSVTRDPRPAGGRSSTHDGTGPCDVVERHGPDRDGGRGRRVGRVEQRRRARPEVAVAVPALEPGIRGQPERRPKRVERLGREPEAGPAPRRRLERDMRDPEPLGGDPRALLAVLVDHEVRRPVAGELERRRGELGREDPGERAVATSTAASRRPGEPCAFRHPREHGRQVRRTREHVPQPDALDRAGPMLAPPMTTTSCPASRAASARGSSGSTWPRAGFVTNAIRMAGPCVSRAGASAGRP